MTRNTLADYQEITGQGVIDELRALADRIQRRSIQHINSTAVGERGRDSDATDSLLRELGLDATWMSQG
jgi:hypothetical protein